MMKLPLRLTYDTDIEKVRKLVKKLGQQLMDDPVIGDRFLQPLKSQGVIQMDDSAMIARVKFMTKPGDQWVVRKRVFAEIRELFAREGIHFAHREVTVRIPDLDKDRPLDDGRAQSNWRCRAQRRWMWSRRPGPRGRAMTARPKPFQIDQTEKGFCSGLNSLSKCLRSDWFNQIRFCSGALPAGNGYGAGAIGIIGASSL